MKENNARKKSDLKCAERKAKYEEI